MYLSKGAKLLYYWIRFTNILPYCALDKVLRAPSMLIGYACIAPDDPHLALQREALTAIGCAEIFEERGSTLLVRARPALGRALDACAAGDVLIICRLNLLGRSPAHAIEILHNLAARGVGLRSLTDGIDLTAPDAALTLRLIHALAEFGHRVMKRGDSTRLKPAGPSLSPPVRPLYRKPNNLTLDQIKRAQRRVDKGETLSHAARTMRVNYVNLWRGLTWLKNLPAGAAD